MLKHIIIAGAPRAGKTTLSRKLQDYYDRYTHYKLDSIKRAVFDIFCPGSKDWHLASKVVSRIIQKVVDDNEQESSKKELFIFDTPHLYPEDLKDFDKEKFLIVFLGYTETTVQAKTDEIIKYDDKSCWTQKLPREKLEELVQGNIEFSKEIRTQCRRHGIKFFDMSNNLPRNVERIYSQILYTNK